MNARALDPDRARARGNFGSRVRGATLFALLALASCSDATPTSEARGPAPLASPAARAVAREPTSAAARAHAVVEALRARSRGAVALASAATFADLAGGRARVVAPEFAARRAHVELPPDASGAASVEDEASGAAVVFALAGTQPAAREVSDGVAVYQGALGAASALIYRPTAAGVEDLVALTEAPRGERLEYAIATRGVAGLRLVAGALELVDALGTPRLRVAPPYVLDAQGARHAATLSVVGCAFDADPRAPWGRAPVAPTPDGGPSRCRVRVAWGGRGVTYPALVDPAWTTTGAPIEGRTFHSATLLHDGHVLVAGGQIGTDPFTAASAELFDPRTATFAVTGSMAAARQQQAAALLDDGTVLVSGGAGLPTAQGPNFLASAEIYAPATGTWSRTGDLATGRADHTEVVLADGTALVAGGTNITPGIGVYFPPNAERYDVATGKFLAAGSLATGRAQHTATRLSDGTVLVVGGQGSTFAALASVERYHPASNTWTAAPSLASARMNHTATRLLDDRVVVLGGDAGGTAEMCDAGAAAWAPAGSLLLARRQHFAALLDDGKVLVTGGVGVTGGLRGEVFDATAAASAFTSPLAAAPTSATKLLDGRVLSVEYDVAEVFARLANAAACASPTDCLSGVCVDGVCCDRACDGVCEACVAVKKGSGADGACGPIAKGADPDGECLDEGSPACGTSGGCDGNGACGRYPGPGCTPSPCSDGTGCASGVCADGICCDVACDGPCQACTAALKGSGIDGVCGPTPASSAPLHGAPCTSSPATCGADGLCDGGGLCRVHAPVGGMCHDTSCSGGELSTYACDASGVCQPSMQACADGCADARSCLGACTGDGDCGGQRCSGGRCVDFLQLGDPCSASAECAPGSLCVDGVCCAGSCGACEACDLPSSPGTCTKIAGAPRRGTCPGEGACAAQCDGVHADCSFVAAGKPCGGATCTAGEEHASACDDQGACTAQPPKPCAPLVCGGDHCVPCTTDDACVEHHACKGGGCVAVSYCEGNTAVNVTGATQDCMAIKCHDGTCPDSCGGDADCIGGFVCGESSTCVARASAADDAPGCSCAEVGRAGPWSSLGAIGAASLAALAARRRRRRAEVRS